MYPVHLLYFPWGVGGGGEGELLSYISHIVMCPPKGGVFAPFWSEDWYKFCPFWSGIGGYGLRKNYGFVSTC